MATQKNGRMAVIAGWQDGSLCITELWNGPSQLPYNIARDTTFVRSARNNNINCIFKRDTYIHTYKHFDRCDAEFLPRAKALGNNETQ